MFGNFPAGWGDAVSFGGLYLQEELFDGALSCFEKAAVLLPRDAKVQVNLGFLYGKQKRYRQATEAYELVFSLEPSLTAVHISLSVIYARHL